MYKEIVDEKIKIQNGLPPFKTYNIGWIYDDDKNSKINEKINNMSLSDMIKYIKDGRTYLKEDLEEFEKSYGGSLYYPLNFNTYLDLDVKKTDKIIFDIYNIESNSYKRCEVKNMYLGSLNKRLIPKDVESFEDVQFIKDLLHYNRKEISEKLKKENVKYLLDLKLELFGEYDNYYIKLKVRGI